MGSLVRDMIAALLLVLALALTVGGAPPPCCTSKVGGGVEYILRTEEDTSGYGCVNNCIFEKKEEPGPLFCFAAGDLEVICDGEFGQGSGPEGGQGSGSEGGEGSGPLGGEGSGNEGGQGSASGFDEGSGAASGEGGGPENGGEGSGQGSGEGSGEGSGVAGGETGVGNGGGDCTAYPADHTMTVYPGPANECGYELKFTGLDEATKKTLLDKHNELRQKVASGGEAGQPGATNMRKLVTTSWPPSHRGGPASAYLIMIKSETCVTGQLLVRMPTNLALTTNTMTITSIRKSVMLFSHGTVR